MDGFLMKSQDVQQVCSWHLTCLTNQFLFVESHVRIHLWYQWFHGNPPYVLKKKTFKESPILVTHSIASHCSEITSYLAFMQWPFLVRVFTQEGHFRKSNVHKRCPTSSKHQWGCWWLFWGLLSTEFYPYKAEVRVPTCSKYEPNDRTGCGT